MLQECYGGTKQFLSTASKLLGIPVMGLQQMYQTRCLGKAMKMISDNRHPVFNEFEFCLQVEDLGYQCLFFFKWEENIF